MTPAQYLDATYFNGLWQRLAAQGKLPLSVPNDETMWQQDLGRSLRVVFDWLGNIDDQQILELGCGPGQYTVMLARRGAHVTAVDIAPAGLSITARRARASGVGRQVRVAYMAAETLALPDKSFDWVVGFGLLHHADLVRLAPEVRRVLRPGGRALFREPLGTNPLLHLVREKIPYRHKNRSRNENPLSYDDIRRMGRQFRRSRWREFYLLSMITRAVGSEMSFPALWTTDEFLIRHVSPLRRWCRYVLIEYAR